MDIYNFLFSQDIAKHCRKIAYEFTPLEMACLIYYSHKTLEEKHEAWQEIIDTRPDMVVEARPWTPYCESLHMFLEDIMDIEKRLVEAFQKDEPNVVYSYEECHAADGEAISNGTIIYPTLVTILTELREYNEEYCSELDSAKIECVRVRKNWIGTDNDIIVEISPEGIIQTICGGEFLLNDGENSVRNSFRGMWIEVPTPFKKGDIVTTKVINDRGYRNIFVLDSLCYERPEKSKTPLGEWEAFIDNGARRWDWSDMGGNCFATNNDGTIYHDHFGDYLSVEYYTGKLEEKDQILTAVSNSLKGDINEDLLLNAYDFVLLRKNVQSKRSIYRNEYLEEMLAKNDIYPESKIVINDNHDDIYSFIPSVDIAEHCRKMAHEFSVFEQAVIIYHSDKTLAKRHGAWKKIIANLPDEKAYKYHGIDTDEIIIESLHAYLKSYMKIENKMTKRIKQRESKAVYSYKIRAFYDDGNNFYPSDNLFGSFENAFEAMTKEVAEYESGEAYEYHMYVQKRWIDTDKKLSVRVDDDGKIVGEWEGSILYFDEEEFELENEHLDYGDLVKAINQGDVSEYVITSEENDILHQFNYLNVYVPVPFCKGDILSYKYGEPFVLEDEDWGYVKGDGNGGLMYLAEGQINSVINSYTMKYGESVFDDFDIASLKIQYYRGKLKGLHRALKVIGKHMKGEVSVTEMMDIVDIIRSEERLKDARSSGYTEAGWIAAGLNKRQEGNNETNVSFNL
jgi:hypothetical protein